MKRIRRMNERTKDYGNWFRNFDIGRVHYMFYHLCISTLCNTGWHSIPPSRMLKQNISFSFTLPSLLACLFGSVCSNWVPDLDIILCIIDDDEISYNFLSPFHFSLLSRIKIFISAIGQNEEKKCKQRGNVLEWWLIKHLISYQCLRRT